MARFHASLLPHRYINNIKMYIYLVSLVYVLWYDVYVDATESVVGGEESLLPDESLRFQIPSHEVFSRGFAMKAEKTLQQLLVKRVQHDPHNQNNESCNSGINIDEEIPQVIATDRLVAVDGQEISLMSLKEALDASPGIATILPLFKSNMEENILSGFVKIEIIQPKMIEFEPTLLERKKEIDHFMKEKEKKKQEAKRKQMEEEEKKIAEENARLEKELELLKQKEQDEKLRMTPHHEVPGKRSSGKEFRYMVEFTTKGPIGLNWDLQIKDRAIVSYLEKNLPADRANVIGAKDQLIELNGVDTSSMGPREVVETYINAKSPRQLVFLVPTVQKVVSKAMSSIRKNYTLGFTEPSIFQGWKIRLDHAYWSQHPDVTSSPQKEYRMSVTNPIHGCFNIVPASEEIGGTSSGNVYLSYRGTCSFTDKVQNIQKIKGKGLILVNNIKGEGRFPKEMPDVDDVATSVTMVSKIDGDLLLSVLQYERAQITYEEVPPMVAPSSTGPAPAPAPPTDAELRDRMNPEKGGRDMVFWYVNSSSTPATTQISTFRILPGFFGGPVVTSLPYRAVMAFPQETGCHPQGLGILATEAIVIVKRGACSFATKLKAVQDVGGAGMIMINSDNSLFPLMSDPRESAGLKIWAATVGSGDGAKIQAILKANSNMPSLVKVLEPPAHPKPADPASKQN